MVNNGFGKNGVLLVNSKQSQDEIVKTGGIIMPSPKVNRTRVDTTCKYIAVCDESQGNAYLIAEIDRVMWVNGNCVIKINNYAPINKPGTWQNLGNRYGFAYLDNPSQMHLYVGRLKLKLIYNSIYDATASNGNGKAKQLSIKFDGNGNGNRQAAASDMPVGETKRSAIITIPRNQTKVVGTNPVDRIAALRKELAELEANRKATLHEMVDALADTQVDAVMDWLTLFVSK